MIDEVVPVWVTGPCREAHCLASQVGVFSIFDVLPDPALMYPMQVARTAARRAEIKTPSAVIVCLIGLVFAATIAPAMAASEWTPEQKEIIATMEQWQKAWDSEDLKTLGRLLPDTIDMTVRSLRNFAPDGRFKDKTSLLNAYVKFKTSQRSEVQHWAINQKIAFVEVKVAGDEASVTRRIDWWDTGGSRNSGTLTKTAQLKKLNGEWKLCSEK
jgi:Domain of unknown function (DUF4440)